MVAAVKGVSDFEYWSMLERGRVLAGEFAHFCHDWDGMTVDETCDEYSCCNCEFAYAPVPSSLEYLTAWRRL